MKSTEHLLAQSHDTNLAVQWDDSHRYTPTSRHRRRLLMNILNKLEFEDCLDAGCAQPYLIEEIVQRFGVRGYGCDLSDQCMASNRRRSPHIQFEALDLARQAWPGGRQFDLVVCSEVLEHILDWQAALANLVKMTRKYLLITVPGGRLRAIEQMLGHYRHYEGPELIEALRENGIEGARLRYWGFPFYSLYKYLISRTAPERLYNSFCTGQKKYGLAQKLVAHVLTGLFYVNDLTNAGEQLVVLARKPPAAGANQKNPRPAGAATR
jgi:hypothetical protein